MKTTLLAKSSSGEPYKVEFTSDGSSLRIFCHCQAGVLHRMCKHKQAFIDGDIRMFFDSNQATQLAEIRSWPQFGALQRRVEKYKAALADLEKAKEELEKKEKEIKAVFGKGLSRGFEQD